MKKAIATLLGCLGLWCTFALMADQPKALPAVMSSSTATMTVHTGWKNWCEKNPQKCLEEWCERHPEVCQEQTCASNPEKCRRQWCEDHPNVCPREWCENHPRECRR